MIDFADPELEQAVRSATGMPTGNVRYENVSELSELTAQSEGIADLTGLGCLRGLTELRLSVNGITDVSPVAELTGLTEL